MILRNHGVDKASISSASAIPRARSVGDLLRVSLLACALAANLWPLYQFIGSMIWFQEYLGDFKVFWGITSVPLVNIYDHRVFAYPPTALVLILPFGLFPFWPSLVLWSIAGAAALSCAARHLMRPLAIAVGFLTYAAIGTLLHGQTSLFVGALIMAGLTASTPRWRGVLLAAAAVIKPQSLLAAPIVLLAERNWRTIGWAITAGCGFLLFSVLLFGLDVWLRWVTELPKFHAYLIDRGIDKMDVGTYGLARSLGLPGWTFLFAVPLGIATSWLVFRREAPPLDRYAAFAVSTVLMSPYTLFYDLAGLTLASVGLLLDRERSPLIWLGAAMVVSSTFAGLGIIVLASMLSFEAISRSKLPVGADRIRSPLNPLR